jgi:imidazolonepropionase-like amidohydrolase
MIVHFHRLRIILLAFIGFCASDLHGQPTFPYNGVRPKEVLSMAITNARVYVDEKTVIEKATVIIEKGKIKAIGQGLVIPANAVVMDYSGLTIYPSFIELDSDYGMAKVESGRDWSRGPQMESNRKGAFGWNEAIKADTRASERWAPTEEAAKELRALGFGTVLTHMHDGIIRGSGALVTLGDQPQLNLLKSQASAHFSFNKGSSRQDYPSSLMGSIALLRQTMYDAQWYTSAGAQQERNLSLEALVELQKLPYFFEAGDKWNILRADKIADEFNLSFILRGGGDEYQRIDDLLRTKSTLIVPLNFPDALDVSDPQLARLATMQELKHWEMAPFNLRLLEEAGIPVAVTSAGLNDRSVFLKNLRKAVANGFKEQAALRSLTSLPAELLGMQNEVGSLRNGCWANFIVTTGNIFNDRTIIRENWIQGKVFTVEPAPVNSIKGTYTLVLPKTSYALVVKEEDGKSKGEITVYRSKKEGGKDTVKVAVSLRQERGSLSLSLQPEDSLYTGVITLSGVIEFGKSGGTGTGVLADGSAVKWSLLPQSTTEPADQKADTPSTTLDIPGKVMYPFSAYGWLEAPKQETVLIRNATLWTNEADSVISEGQLLISGGKIVAVGKLVDASKFPGVRIIDAMGKHVTAGIIDEHSHIATSSVNEGTQASSAEVQIGSVLYPDDIDIYRQLSGGVTAAQILHGSANPIGGQSALIKMRWGLAGDQMLIANAPGFIKFALGENVKQSNWGEMSRVRYPQTRMGVEQVYYDHFIRAREYGAVWKLYLGGQKKLPAPRRDLELDALHEILEKKRFITCHSYVQSEINMLMHVGDSMGFRINTFTHILEGYKLADKMKEHGAAASSFSDWWAYKMEVKDAIPHNGALLWKNGLTVAFNSDDAEMARRLNQEAAKAVKYGGVPESEALKFVTLNPATMLHLNDRMGSLKAGKDADVVIWSDHPLSVYAKAEQTFVDGICYYSMEKDMAMRAWMQSERARIIQKMLNAKAAGEPVQTPKFKERKHFHCDTLDQTSVGVQFKQ